MSIKGKRLLSVITYYTLIGLAIAMAVGFIFAMGMRVFPLWAKVVYIAWAGVVIGTLIFDIYCTANNRYKFVSGMMVYVLSVLCVAVSVIIYLMYTTRTGLAMNIAGIFTLSAALSYAVSLFMVAAFIVGESLIEHNTSAKELKQRGVRE